MFDRTEQIKNWLATLGCDLKSFEVASADASFRRYFRVNKDGVSCIAMDAPPEHESCVEFVSIAKLLCLNGINAPEIIAEDQINGFLLLSDLGNQSLLSQLDEHNVDAFYSDAMDVLLQMQLEMPSDQLNHYGNGLLEIELNLFIEWFLNQLLGLELNQKQLQQWEQSKKLLMQSALEQPQVFVHRDYHSRNLMLDKQQVLGVIDFQDAVKGPITYDLVSLLRDCYVEWPISKVEKWVNEYHQHLIFNNLTHSTAAQFLTWFNLMGVQRHLKVLGIFSRLKLRDGKNDYMKDLPLTFKYISQVIEKEPCLAGLAELIKGLNIDQKLKKITDE